MPTEQLIPREQVLQRLNVSDSTERRKRQSGQNWPAHISVGHRILYRESGVNAWIAAQERIDTQTGTSKADGLTPDVEAAIERRAMELAAQAPLLSARQVAQLQEIFAHPAGGHER
jgi:predicted DNA-binding transcriptional regulator AlpA